MSYGITNTGFISKEFSVILSELQQEAVRVFGDSTDLRQTNPLMILLNIMAAREQVLWNSLADMYSNFFIITANGTALDLLAVDRGLTRTAAVKATGTVTVTGTAGTDINAGSTFSTSGDNVVTFTSTAAGGIGLLSEDFLKAAMTNTSGTIYRMTLTNVPFGSLGDLKTSVIVGATSYTQVAGISPASGEFSVDYVNKHVYIGDDPTTSTTTVTYYNSAATTVDLTIQASVGGTAHNVSAGRVNTVVSNIAGISAVTNALAVSGGTNEETDGALRQRLIDVPVAEWTEDDLRVVIENITGVKSAVIDDGEKVETFSSTVSGSGPYTVDLTTDASDVFRATFYDDSAGTRTDLELVTTSPSAGQYRLIKNTSPTADQIEFDLSVSFDTSNDTLTVTYMDAAVGVGIFTTTIVPDSPPLSASLRDTVESTIKLNKPFGVSFLVLEPTFSTVGLAITLSLQSGYTVDGVTSDINTAITNYFNTLSIGDGVKHYQLIEFIMVATGVADVSSIEYSIQNEVVTRGTTVGGDDAVSQSASANTVDGLPATITDDKGNVYTLSTDYELNSENIRWSTAGAITTAKTAQDDGGSFTDDATTLFVTTVDVDDAFYLGTDAVFNLVVLDLTTAATSTNLAYEYYNGVAWVSLSNVVDSSSGLTDSSANNQYISFTKPADWATVAINSRSAYWIRLRATGAQLGSDPIISGLPEFHYEPAPDSTYTVSAYDVSLDVNTSTLAIAGLPATTNRLYTEGTVSLS